MKDILTDWGERLIIILLFAGFAVGNVRSGDWTNYLLVLLEAVSVVLILIRRRAISVSERPLDWALAVAGTMAPLLIRPGGEALAGWLATGLVIVGTAISFAAKISLNRRFAMTPANRGVQAGFAYALVRHPMYLGYIIAQAGYLMHNPTVRNAFVYAAAWSLQLARIRREESHLLEDPDYRAYASRVRYRLVPGLF
jgi:protein-S-isoprenylcysteine O-methyltransferase Ste14